VIYLDNAATTPLDPEVIEEMYTFMKTCYGNPSSKYYEQAELAKKHLNTARKQVSNLLGCTSEELIFTSGSTEGNNFVLKGIPDSNQHIGKHIITSKVEHKAVLNTCKWLETKGYDVTYLDVDSTGKVELDTLKKNLREDTVLVSLIWGNNEIGTLNNIKELSSITKANSNAYFHTDATQVVGKLEFSLDEYEIDFLTCSSHKLYGPKGIGACFIRNDEYGLRPEITPLLHGGSQEDGLRAGTYAMHDIVGFGKACEIANNTMTDYIPKIIENENLYKEELIKAIPEITFNGDQHNKIPGIINFSIPGINNEFLIKMLADEIAISSGSACALGEASHVQKTLENEINYFRLTFSKFNSKATNVKEIVDILKKSLITLGGSYIDNSRSGHKSNGIK